MIKRTFSRKGGTVSVRLLSAVAACVLLPVLLIADGPQWWPTNGNDANDYAAINQGQVKNLATAAVAEMDAHLPGGAGEGLHTLIAGWATPTGTTNDYAAINLGQLKNLAKPFYDRLIAVGYVTGYPWNATGHGTANDYAMANIGQVKNLFSFDFTATDTAHDANQDGIPDWWESYYGITDANAQALRGDGLTNLQAYQQGLNPNDFYNGQIPVLTKAGGDAQTGNPNGFVPLPLIVSVKNSAGTALANAPVTFTVTSGGGTLQKTNLTTASGTLTVNADGDGMAKVYFKLPNTQNANCQVTATAGTGTHTAQVAFTESSDDGTGSHADPFAPSNVVAIYNSDGSVDVSWTANPNSDDNTPTPIQYKDADGNWVTFATAPAGATSCHVPAQ
jgi:hypothetical protein